MAVAAANDYQAVRGKLQFKLSSEDFRLELRADFTNNFQMPARPTRCRSENAHRRTSASPAFGGANPCGGNPVFQHLRSPWHSPSKYYGAFATCTVPAPAFLVRTPAPVTGVCQIVSRQESTISDLGFESDYDFGFGALTLLGNEEQIRGGSLGKESANPFNGQVPPNAMWSNITIRYSKRG